MEWLVLSAERVLTSKLLSFPCPQTLYKTQIRELKEECDERNKLYRDAQQRLEDFQEERYCPYRSKFRPATHHN